MTITAEWILAIGALLTAFVGFLTYRNSARKDSVQFLQAESNRAHERLEKVEKERNEFADRIESLESERDIYKAQSYQRDAVIVGQESRILKMTDELEKMRADLPRLYDHLDYMGKQANQLTLENGDLKAQNLHLQTQVRLKDQEIGRLHEQLIRIETDG